ncbi:apolipoprotein N-acyltransferase [Rhodocaloribacter sp.]
MTSLRNIARSPALLTGLLLGLSFPPLPFPFLAWVAFVPLLRRWDDAPPGSRMLLEAYLAFLITYAVAFFWPLFHALPQTVLASITPLLALPLVMALPVGASALVRRRLGRGPGLVALVAFFLVTEGALSRGPFAFPWSLVGHTQAEALRFNQFAEWTGTPGLSLWVLFLNVAAFAVVRPRASRRLPLVALALLLVLPFAFSRWRRASLPPPRGYAAVGLVQPALPPLAWADVHDAARVDTLLALTEPLFSDAALRPRLVVWPETALPVFTDPARRDALHARLQTFVDRHEAALLTGAVTLAPGGDAYRNSALLFRPHRPPERYDKVRLVPFAEYVPFSERFPWLRALSAPAGGVSGYRPGVHPRVLQAGDLTLGVLICFESIFGNPSRAYVEQGADFLVTITQDGWWGRTPGYRQHFAFTRLRAVETRRAVVQVSVTGVSGLIDAGGAARFEAGWMKRSARTALVPLRSGETFFARHGDLVTPLAAFVAFLLAAATALEARRAKKRRRY